MSATDTIGAARRNMEICNACRYCEGFCAVFAALDRILKMIRRSDGKADAAQQIRARFRLDAEQTDAILELRLYRLARLEILVIQKELAAKRKRVRQIERTSLRKLRAAMEEHPAA